jgi:hypothetical protein
MKVFTKKIVGATKQRFLEEILKFNDKISDSF